MQPIHVLSDQPKVRAAPLEFNHSVVSRIRQFCGDQFASPVVPLPDESGITLKSFRCCEVLGSKVAPQAVRAAKGRHTAISGNTRDGPHSKRTGGGKLFLQECEVRSTRHVCNL